MRAAPGILIGPAFGAGPIGLLPLLTIPVGAALNMVVLPVRNGLPGESSAAAWAEATTWVLAAAGVATAAVRYARTPLTSR
ncbi:hypothetical protein [Paractinoplanes maris]|uniref:hypothetical protein n=1 Tax=Paractinoplanes maris TaxID=1734446 RepID=UPI00202101E6|nr:hypothetical protein [Actinoplanes maris]